jgi:hypothetical protein
MDDAIARTQRDAAAGADEGRQDVELEGNPHILAINLM